jgi:CO dehydrogenase maturation factor
MSYRIAVVGKGGVGKSTISAMLVRALYESSGKLLMAVDADPNANLGEKLGVRPEHTIGELREQLLNRGEELPPGQSKQEYVEYQMRLATVEGQGFDLLSMGRPEGPGCYCYINNILRTFLDLAMDKYDYVVIDNEAGMEHLSRRTTKRLLALTKEMGLDVKKKVLMINGVREALHTVVQQEVDKLDVDEEVRIPFSEEVLNFSTEGLSIWELSEADHAYKALSTAIKRIV